MSDDLDFMPAGPDAGKDEPKGASEAASKPATPESKSADKSADKSAGGEGEGERVDLPTWNRARRKRKANVKAAEQDDAFQRGVRKAGRQVIDTPKLVIGAIVIVVAAIAGGVALGNKRAAADAEATRILHGATAAIVRAQIVPPEKQVGMEDQIARAPIPVYASEDEREAAIVEALTAAKASGRAQVTLDATLLEAAHAVRTGDFEAAVTGYDAFLAECGDDHPLRFLALEGKGVALEGKGELEAALAVFEALAPAESDFYRNMALYHRGRVLEALERKDEAIAIYQQFFTEFPGKENLATPMVRARIEELDPAFAARLTAPPSMFDDPMGGLSLP